MQSLKRALGDSQAAADAAIAATPAADPATWNRTTVAAGMLLALLVLPGCFERTVYVPAAQPILAPPVRPLVPTEPAAWTERERILAGYATALEALVGEYNRRARESNKANGY